MSGILQGPAFGVLVQAGPRCLRELAAVLEVVGWVYELDVCIAVGPELVEVQPAGAVLVVVAAKVGLLEAAPVVVAVAVIVESVEVAEPAAAKASLQLALLPKHGHLYGGSYQISPYLSKLPFCSLVHFSLISVFVCIFFFFLWCTIVHPSSTLIILIVSCSFC